MDKLLTGHNELIAAISNRSELFKSYDYLQYQAESQGFISPDLRKLIPLLEQADKDIKNLKLEYPKAASYINWIDKDPSSDMGFKARLAAKALLKGASLKDAEKIANDWICTN